MKKVGFGSISVLWLAVVFFCVAMASQISAAEPASAGAFQWKKTGDTWRLVHPAYANQLIAADKGNDAVAEQWVKMSDDELRKQIDATGIPPGKGSPNVRAKDAAYYLAKRYADTGDKRYAHAAAVLFARFAEVFPEWPFYDRGGKPSPQSGTPVYYGSMWGSTWYYYDLDQPALNVAKAWDLIQDSGAVEALGPDVRRRIETDFLERNLKIYTERYPRIFSNVDADLLYGLMVWGLATNDPAVVHKGARWARELYQVSFYESGAWHEALGSYELMIGCRLDWAIRQNPLKGYSDPPGWTDPVDGTRFDNLDLEKELKPRMDRVIEVMRRTILPNGRFAAIHDSHWGDNNKRATLPPGVRDYLPTEQRPYIIYDFGHAIMGSGRGADQSQVHLHFSGARSHEHLDNLNLILFAKGKELFSETNYQGNREWQTSTAGHNTVVIDEKSQNRKGTGNQRKIDPVLDAIPNVPDYPLTADKTAGDHHLAMNDGNLELWEAGYDAVQVAEAAAEKAYYPNSPDIYRRTLARVAGTGPDFYVVDIFRVKGGTTHDWMLHGNLEEPYKLQTPLKLGPATGKIHQYIQLEQSAKTDGPLETSFVSPDGTAVRTLMTGAAGTEVLVGQGPAMRRSGTATFLDVRRTGGDNTFVAVHEPYVGRPLVGKIAQLAPARGSSAGAVALKVELADRTDYFLSTLGAAEKVAVQDGALRLSLTGHAGVVSVKGGKVAKLYLVDGAKLEAGGETVTAEGSDGVVTASQSVYNGDKANTFEVEGKLAEGAALKGRTILLTDGEGATHGFEIDSVASQGGKTLVTLTDDPGVQIREGVYKMLFFPSWGVKGKVTYHVGGTALKEF